VAWDNLGLAATAGIVNPKCLRDPPEEPCGYSRDNAQMPVGSTDAVIGTRYHNVVGAPMMNRPVISLGYAAKFVDTMTSTGLGRYRHDVQAIAPDAVLNDLDELLGKWDEFSPGVDACQPAVHGGTENVSSRP
jgi:polysaccharide pyruvyl transferase WcaK-like protein